MVQPLDAGAVFAPLTFITNTAPVIEEGTLVQLNSPFPTIRCASYGISSSGQVASVSQYPTFTRNTPECGENYFTGNLSHSPLLPKALHSRGFCSLCRQA